MHCTFTWENWMAWRIHWYLNNEIKLLIFSISQRDMVLNEPWNGSRISAWLNFIKVGWFEASILPNWICTIIAIYKECCNIPKEEMHSGPEAVELIPTRDRQYKVTNRFLHQMIIEEHPRFFHKAAICNSARDGFKSFHILLAEFL